MKHTIIFTLVLLSIFLAACSKDSSEPAPGDSLGPGASADVPTAVPGPDSMLNAMPGQSAGDMAPQQSAIPAPPLPEHVSKVLTVLEVPETRTMYLELKGETESVWIATKFMDVAVGDEVKYQMENAVIMENFESKRLNRTFDKVMLVASAEKVGGTDNAADADAMTGDENAPEAVSETVSEPDAVMSAESSMDADMTASDQDEEVMESEDAATAGDMSPATTDN